MAEFTHNGIRYRELPNGQAEVIGPVSTGGGTYIPPSTTTRRTKEAGAEKAEIDVQTEAARLPTVAPQANADLTGTELDNEAKRIAIMEGRFGKLTPGYRWKADGTGAERIPGLAPDNESAGSGQKLANLKTLQAQIARVRELHESATKGGMPNWFNRFVPDFVNSELGQFDTAGAGMGEVGMAAFRVPGAGSQSDTELLKFVSANEPRSTDSDATIEEKLRTVETRLNNSLRAMGVDPATAAKVVGGNAGGIPRARAVGEDPSGMGPTGGVTSRGGFTQVPSLKGIGQEVANMIEGGYSPQQVNDYLAQRYAETQTEHGGRLGVSAEQRAFFNDAIAKRRATPERPLSDFITGFDRLGGYEVPESDGGLLGNIADGSSFMGEAGKDLASGVMSAGNAVTFGNMANLAGNDAGAVLDASRRDDPWAAFAGDMVGSGLAMGGLGGAAGKAGLTGLARFGGLGGDMLYGGVRGASETEGGLGDKVKGGLFGLAAAGGGNVIGRGIVGGLGRAGRGVSNEAVRMLNERGISMTPGQILGQDGFIGRRLGALENAIESVPFIGGNFRDRRMQGVGEYGRAQLEENLGSIGFDAGAGQFDGDMLGRAQQAVGDSYSFLDGRTFQPDQQVVSDLTSALGAGRAVPRVGDEFGAIMDRNIGPLFDNGGNLSGRGFQDALQTLRGARSDFATDGAMGGMAGNAVGDIEAALMGMVQRQAPDAIEDLARSNQAYAGLVPIENASITATNAGNAFTPAQYGRAAVNNTRRYGGRGAAARGDIPGGDLQRAAQEVLPSAIPNSGTADRGMAAMLLPAALGGGAVAAQGLTDDPLLTALLLGLGGASTQTGQRAIQRALLDRPDALRNAGEYVYQLRDLGGRGGATLGAGSIPWLLANE